MDDPHFGYKQELVPKKTTKTLGNTSRQWACMHAFVSKIELHLIHYMYLVLVFKSQHDEYIGIHVPMGKGLGLLL
jgi:hypothetical protein